MRYLSFVAIGLLLAGCALELDAPGRTGASLPEGVAGTSDAMADAEDGTAPDVSDTSDAMDMAPDMTPDFVGGRPPGCPQMPADTPSGFHEIDPEQDGTGMLVYCDMETRGGGWTLIARSDSGQPAGSGFGWFGATGTAPDDTSQPYSMNIDNLPPFTEVLVGSRNVHAWVTAFWMPISREQVDMCRMQGCSVQSIAMVEGTQCDQSVVPRMLQNFGYTDNRSGFFFRDSPDPGQYGLRTDVWRSISDCSGGGGLDGLPGLVMVR